MDLQVQGRCYALLDGHNVGSRNDHQISIYALLTFDLLSYHAFWKPCITRWRVEMHQKLSTIESSLISTVRVKFGNFAMDLLDKAEPYPSLFDCLKKSMYVLTHELEAFICVVREKFAWYRKTARDYRLCTKKLFEDEMRPGFEAAVPKAGESATISYMVHVQMRNCGILPFHTGLTPSFIGVGSFRKQRDIMRAHVETIRDSIFKTCRDDLEARLKSDKNLMIKEIREYWRDSSSVRIRKHLEKIMRLVCPSIRVKASELNEVPAPTALSGTLSGDTKSAIRLAVDAWNETWTLVEPRLPKPDIGMTFDDAERLDKQKVEAQEARKEAKAARKDKAEAKKAAKAASKKVSTERMKAKCKVTINESGNEDTDHTGAEKVMIKQEVDER